MGITARLSVCVAAVLIMASCSTIRLDENIADYADEIAQLQGRLLVDPQSADAMSDLGAIYMRTGYPIEASERLQNAYALGNREPKTLFFLGLANEELGKTQTAIRLYENYADVSTLSPYRSLMQGRYAWLVREAAHQELRQRLSEEADISDSDVAEDVIAVFPLTYLGRDRRYDPIGRGLSEMMTIDLQNVSGIRVVERTRLQVLIDELNLSASDRVDQGSAPRMGRLLRAGRVVGGTYNVLSGDNLTLDASVVQTITSDLNDVPTQSDNLNNFFQLEKQVVFGLLDEFGVELTEAERSQIEQIPTQNLQAFLAFCRGLIEEDQLNFQAAATLFQQAVALDPGFSLARARGDMATGLGSAAGPRNNAMMGARRLEPGGGPGLNLMSSRINQLRAGIGSPMLPGPDARKPGPEASAAGVTGGDLLPPPPPPPGGN